VRNQRQIEKTGRHVRQNSNETTLSTLIFGLEGRHGGLRLMEELRTEVLGLTKWKKEEKGFKKSEM